MVQSHTKVTTIHNKLTTLYTTTAAIQLELIYDIKGCRDLATQKSRPENVLRACLHKLIEPQNSAWASH